MARLQRVVVLIRVRPAGKLHWFFIGEQFKGACHLAAQATNTKLTIVSYTMIRKLDSKYITPGLYW